MAEIAGTMLRVAGIVLLDAALLVSLVAIPIGLPGNFAILALALVLALVTKFALVGWGAIALFAGAALAGEIIEGLLGPIVAGRYGATKWGVAGALVGGIAGGVAGTAVLPVVGTLIGSFAGTALGAPLLEWSRGASTGEGVRAGFGAFLGRGIASAVTLAIGISLAAWLVARVHGS